MQKKTSLTVAEIEECMRELSGWKPEEGKRIVKSYLFASFVEAIAFVNRVAEIAERQNHHPFISIDYRRVGIRLTSWNAGGLTALDFAAAKAYDELAGQ